MVSSKDADCAIQKSVLNGVKSPHKSSYPVVYEEDGAYYLAVFVFLYTREDIETGSIDRPTIWALCDIESGELKAEYQTREKEFSGASYDTKYDVHSDGEYDTSKEYYEKAFAILDSVREKIITEGVFDKSEYAEYMDMILANIPKEYKRFYTDLSVDYSDTKEDEPDADDNTQDTASSTIDETKDNTMSEDIDEIKDALAKLQKSFDEKIARDEHKNVLFDNMHRELTKYQNGALDKRIDSMALDIIMLSDNVKRVIAQNENVEPNEESFKKLIRQLQGIYEELEDILYRENIEPYSVAGDDVDVKKQKIIGAIDTDDESLNNKIAERGIEGYEKEDRVLRRENVKIYKYKETKEADNN